MKKRFWMAAIACFVLAAVCVLLPCPWAWLRISLRVLSFPMLVGALLLVVNAMLPIGALPVPGLEEEGHGARPFAPSAPSLPEEIPLDQRILGSLRGAGTAMEGMADSFAQPPMLAWQFDRLRQNCAALLDRLEGEDGQPGQAADFALQYLPNVMQYLMACRHEGCPDGTAHTLALAARACERQLDALDAGKYVTFEEEFYALRQDMQSARFRWDW